MSMPRGVYREQPQMARLGQGPGGHDRNERRMSIVTPNTATPTAYRNSDACRTITSRTS